MMLRAFMNPLLRHSQILHGASPRSTGRSVCFGRGVIHALPIVISDVPTIGRPQPDARAMASENDLVTFNVVEHRRLNTEPPLIHPSVVEAL